ncbi:hypothetical protein BGX23_001338, partial [Mortierella sp. AD031]
VSGGKVGDSVLVRSIQSCSRRWRQLFPPASAGNGFWTKEEERLLQEAISEQFEGKYQVAIDVLGEKYAAERLDPWIWRPEFRQLPSQAGLTILKVGSRRLRLLSWAAIEEKVRSRHQEGYRGHFYGMYHNAKRGPWSMEERERLEEGYRLFGKDNAKIMEHVGTRSKLQVNDALRYARKRLEAVEVKKEAAVDKKQQ